MRQLQCGFTAAAALALVWGGAASAQVTSKPQAAHALAGDSKGGSGDIPAKFERRTDAFDYIKRDVMIPMRDGARLHTVIVIPKGAQHAPMMLDRTPYNASKLTSRAPSPNLAAILSPAYAELATHGYIMVAQDVRGKYGSEGDYVMNRPVVGPLNPTRVDHSTDAYDTIDWLVKHVPESNGRVGTIGTSYDGFTVLMSLVKPHPALKAAVPINPMVDVWKGDDWFHNGAFREEMMDYIYAQTAKKDNSEDWWIAGYDDYTNYLQASSAGAYGRQKGMDQLPFWNRLTQHPDYDAFWQGQAVDKILAAQPLTVPTLFVDSLWDQEDIYGAPAAYAAVKPKDTRGDMAYLVMGPWHHGQGNSDGSVLGPFKWDGDTGAQFRRTVLIPFLDSRLKDNGAPADIAPVTAYETGTNTWRRYDRWPLSCAQGCPTGTTPMYLTGGAQLSFTAPVAGGASYDEYISDPAKPVTYRPRPIRPTFASDSTWRRWLVDDQRFASDRTDVLTYTTPVLTEPVKIAGQPIAHLFASTSGTDSDWVVKLIDVYPDEVATQTELGGYQLAVSMDILRGRYRDDPAHPRPITPNQVTPYTLTMPNADHVFLPGHRIMVQIQSSWFPLYDRNPQTYVSNIFFAKPADYVKATQRVFHAPGQASSIELPIVPASAH